MKRMTCCTILIALVLLATFAVAQNGPFGFQYGMTKGQVSALIGAKNVKQSSNDLVVEVLTAPKPHPAFESYFLIFSDKGLVKILASGKNITDNYGDDTKRQVNTIKEAISEKYGTANVIDYLRYGSIWKEPNEWTMGVYKKERTLMTYWNLRSAPVNHITFISLDVAAVNSGTTYLQLTYEFEGFEEYIDKVKDKQNRDTF